MGGEFAQGRFAEADARHAAFLPVELARVWSQARLGRVGDIHAPKQSDYDAMAPRALYPTVRRCAAIAAWTRATTCARCAL